MTSKTVVIKSKVGLHARPAAIFVKKSRIFDCDITLQKDSRTANGKSIIGIMALGAHYGDEINIIAEGNDEEKATVELAKLLDSLEENEENE